jgi:hypothetical protein
MERGRVMVDREGGQGGRRVRKCNDKMRETGNVRKVIYSLRTDTRHTVLTLDFVIMERTAVELQMDTWA